MSYFVICNFEIVDMMFVGQDLLLDMFNQDTPTISTVKYLDSVMYIDFRYTDSATVR